ncbi:MAG: hypothetical protein WKG01_08400 [Kofleriaceae bacterium]
MPAREAESLETEVEPATEVAVAEPEAAQTAFTTEGDLPAVATSAVATGMTASEMAYAPVDAAALDKGMHSAEHYQAECERLGKPEKWQDYYRNGHTDAKGWSQPYERRANNDWILEQGFSASQALTDFMNGPTICDYRVALLADELDELRSELGDIKFDEVFGSSNHHTDAAIPVAQRLKISSGLYTTPIVDQMKAIVREHDSHDSGDVEAPTPVVEARVEERPAVAAQLDQEPAIVAQELGLEQQDRELV